MKHHFIKTKPEWFNAIARGKNYLDLRISDQPEGYEFLPGDAVSLEEWFPSAETGTGAVLSRNLFEIDSFRPGHLRLIFTTATSPKGA